MTAPTAKKGRKPLASSDPCPRGCKTISTGAAHLLSDHSEEKTRQCNLCSCVIQDVHAQQPNDLTAS